MVWHIKKTSSLGGHTIYYKGNNSWTHEFDKRSTYTSQAKAKAEDYIWGKKVSNGWDVVAINENA